MEKILRFVRRFIPNSKEYNKLPFKAPRCKKCQHNDPDFKCNDVDPQTKFISLECIYCNAISVKN